MLGFNSAYEHRSNNLEGSSMRIRIAVVGALAMLALTSACGTDDSSSGGTTGESSTKADSGTAIEVVPKLIEQGFAKGQIAAIAPNSAFWLLPFNTPNSMSQNPTGKSTCVFRMVREDFGTDPAKKAYVNYPILSGSQVKLTARLVTPAGEMTDTLPGEKVVAITDVTPSLLATGTGIDLAKCEDTTLR